MTSGGQTTATEPRRRDAAKTRRLLLDAARRRFAEAGYSATTVRDIADDAGVNVALISRYFHSKEGLFEACLTAAVDDMRRATGDVTLAELPRLMAAQVTGQDAEGMAKQLALMLRSSGDARADEIRIGTLRSSAEKLAAAGGWRGGDDELLLQAELVLATMVGITLLRSSLPLTPLATAGEEDLVGPITLLIRALLPATAE